MTNAVVSDDLHDSSDVKIGKNASGFLTFLASWQDLIAGYSEKSATPIQASSLTWTLSKGGNSVLSGSFTDQLSGPDVGNIVIAESALAPGEYNLKLNGLWTVSGITKGWHAYEDAHLNLSEHGTFSVTSPVPEPESYAMFLAGLGLMVTIALRRKKSDIS
jgi:hypothetical protein